MTSRCYVTLDTEDVVDVDIWAAAAAAGRLMRARAGKCSKDSLKGGSRCAYEVAALSRHGDVDGRLVRSLPTWKSLFYILGSD